MEHVSERPTQSTVPRTAPGAGREDRAPVMFLCRSGARSHTLQQRQPKRVIPTPTTCSRDSRARRIRTAIAYGQRCDAATGQGRPTLWRRSALPVAASRRRPYRDGRADPSRPRIPRARCRSWDNPLGLPLLQRGESVLPEPAQEHYRCFGLRDPRLELFEEPWDCVGRSDTCSIRSIPIQEYDRHSPNSAWVRTSTSFRFRVILHQRVRFEWQQCSSVG